ncbi:MAG: polymerase-associated protein RapA [Pseudomonadota bacterium]
MLNIMPGQRWISTAEPELGLGTILRADARQSDIIFTGCGELKHFTHASSPLLRVRFEIGDSIQMDGAVRTVDAVTEDSSGTLSYCCAGETLHEGSIDPEQPHLPASLRLLIAQYDAAYLFELRRRALQADTLDQDAYELFAIALLSHFGCRFMPVSEHVFLLDAETSELEPGFDKSTPCRFGNDENFSEGHSIHGGHPLMRTALERFLQSRAGSAGFLIDDTLPARSAVLETSTDGCVSLLSLDVRGNHLSVYTPNEQAVFRSRDSQIDMKPFMRSLSQIYPTLLETSLLHAAQSDAGKLEALRLVVGAEFALFGKKSR